MTTWINNLLPIPTQQSNNTNNNHNVLTDLVWPCHYRFDTHDATISHTTSNKPGAPQRVQSSSLSSGGNEIDMHNTSWDQIDLPKFIVSLTVFSTLENIVFYPFSVLKTREQSDHSKLSPLQSFKYHLSASIKHQHGLRNLYKGFWFSSGANLPAYGAYTAVYTSVKQYLGYIPGKSVHEIGYIAAFAPLIAGAVADVASVPLFVPGDVITQRLQLASSPYKNARDAFRQIVNQSGYSGLFVGLNATIITSTIASAVWWQSYETTKSFLYKPNIIDNLYWPNSESGSVNRWPMILAGFVAGEVTSIVVNPLDVVKTRLQTQASTQLSGVTNQVQYTGTFSGLRQLWQHEGAAGLFRGVVPKMLSRGPLSAVTSLTYEFILYYARKDVHIT